MKGRGIRCGEREGLLRGNHFHPCAHASGEVASAAHDLLELLAQAGDTGMSEKALLAWFAQSTARVALLGHAGGDILPTHVARELVLGQMRADFALLQVPSRPDAAAKLLLVECQGALPKSMFEAGNRQMLYWGHDFLDGFSQLVDWHFVGSQSTLNQEIALLISEGSRVLETSFLLVAGLQRFAKDHLSQKRILAWGQALPLGSNFKVKRFDDLAQDALNWTSACVDWVSRDPVSRYSPQPARVLNPSQVGLVGRSSVPETARNDEAARLGRLRDLAGGGAGH